MARRLQSALMVIAGLCWLAFALVICFVLYQYLAGGAGIQVFGFLSVSSTSVLLGTIHVVGFIAAACLFFVIGVGLCAHGLAPRSKAEEEVSQLN